MNKKLSTKLKLKPIIFYTVNNPEIIYGLYLKDVRAMLQVLIWTIMREAKYK